jgi:predicted kinase
MAKNVVIMRGTSGSGKSTYAKAQIPEPKIILSSDDYWTRGGGDYKENFNVEKLGAAHAWNLRRYIDCLSFESRTRENDLTVVIDNTNTSIAELAPYYAVAQAFQVPVEIVTLMVDPKIALARNVHGVPLNAHSAQYSRLVDNTPLIPRWWKHSIIPSA